MLWLGIWDSHTNVEGIWPCAGRYVFQYVTCVGWVGKDLRFQPAKLLLVIAQSIAMDTGCVVLGQHTMC